jgi:hypothetical protein
MPGAANPSAYEPDLVSSLTNLSDRFAELSREDEPQAARGEAASLRRRQREEPLEQLARPAD